MNVDMINDTITLTCSSWGRTYTIDFNDLYYNSGLTSGVVVIEN